MELVAKLKYFVYLFFHHFLYTQVLEPRMCQHLINIILKAKSIFRISHEHFGNKVLAFLGNSDLLTESQLPLLNELKHQTLLLIIEGRQPIHHLIGQNAQTPPICSLAIATAINHLRSKILRRTTERRRKLPFLQNLRHSKISEAGVTLIIHQHVLELEVAVHDALRVEVAEAQGDLHHVELGAFLLEFLGV